MNILGGHWGLWSYDNNGWKQKLDETNTLIVKVSLNLRAHFCESTFTLRKLIGFLIYTLDKSNTSPLCIILRSLILGVYVA